MAFVALESKTPEEVERAALAQCVIHRKPRFPRLRPALGRVKQFRLRGQPIEVVPFRLEVTDRRCRLPLQLDPLDVIEMMSKEIVEILVEVPVPKMRAVEQHD